jgi:hypothetical protein
LPRPVSERSIDHMRPRIGLATLLALALLTLAALAHASPPDETWLPGIYDAADFDDVVILITSLKGAPPEAAVTVTRPGPLVSALVVSPGPGELPQCSCRSDDARSPPFS